MNPYFSIIIPSFNRAAMIGKAIDSILAQTFEDFEILVIDDGSQDDTKRVVERSTDSRIRYFWKENQERSIARNFGIANASGRYINFLDSDDRFYPHHLQTAFNLLKRNNDPEVGHLGYEVVNERGDVLTRRADLDEHIASRLIRENILHCNGIFIKRSVALEQPFPDHPDAVISEDWYLFLKLASRYKIRYDNTISSAILEHEHRSLRNIDPDRLVASTAVIVAGLAHDPGFLKRYGRKVNYFFANQYTLVALVLALTRTRRKDTLHYLRKSFRYDFTVVFRKRFLAAVKHWF